MTIEYSNPNTVAAPDGHFSQAVSVDAATRLLFISGQVPRALDGSTVGAGDMKKQAEQVFENLRAILAAHGSSFDKVVKATLFTTDFSRADEVAAVRERFYGNAKPASTWVEVRALGDAEWMLEVELVAAI
jgi:2-iminobutanoate/2-iminopropanoate deaminase